MTLPFKPHLLALLCSAGLFAASGVMFVKSRAPQAPTPAAPVAAAPQTPAEPVPAPVATPDTAVKPAFTTAQIDQWVAPIALYPDPLLSQVLMAATYPANLVQAVQWSHDNPTLQGDKAIQAVSGQPWDPSVKSLVAFPQLMALMGENPEWVQNLGDAFLAQPQDVMDAVQRLRRLAQQTGTLKTTVEQKVITTPKTVVAAPSPAGSKTTVVTSSPAPAPTIISIEPANPEVVYIPNYNPTVVYGSWPYAENPPVYLPPPQGEPFVDSFVRGFGYSMGVATTYALFSSIDWDDDHDHHHHDDHHDDHHHDDGYHGGNGWSHNGDNININVNNFNHITGQHLSGQTLHWQHNPAYRDGVPYNTPAVAQRFHQTNVPGGLSATQHTPSLPAAVNRDSQRQAAMTQLQQRTHTAQPGGTATRNSQRAAAAKDLDQIARRNSYRGYDDNAQSSVRSAVHNATPQQRDNARQRLNDASPQQRQAARETLHNATSQQHGLSQQQRDNAHQRLNNASPQQRQAVRQHVQNTRPTVFSGNDSRSPSWQSQQQRGQQSLRSGGIHAQPQQRAAARQQIQQHRELRHR